MEHPAGARLPHGPPAETASPDQPPDIDVRGQLARILASDFFSRSDRLSAFLTFIVEQTLQRQGHSLKEHVLAIELYGKDADFSTAADPIVKSGYRFALGGTGTTDDMLGCTGLAGLASYQLTADPVNPGASGLRYFGTNTERAVFEDIATFAGNMPETGNPGHGIELR